MKCKLKKGDMVEMTVGKDRGKKGKILKVFRDEGRAVIENVNLVEKKQKPTQENPKGGIIKIEESVPASRMMIVCSACNKRTRIGMKSTDNKQKLRYCKKCNESLDKK